MRAAGAPVRVQHCHRSARVSIGIGPRTTTVDHLRGSRGVVNDVGFVEQVDEVHRQPSVILQQLLHELGAGPSKKHVVSSIARQGSMRVVGLFLQAHLNSLAARRKGQHHFARRALVDRQLLEYLSHRLAESARHDDNVNRRRLGMDQGQTARLSFLHRHALLTAHFPSSCWAARRRPKRREPLSSPDTLQMSCPTRPQQSPTNI